MSERADPRAYAFEAFRRAQVVYIIYIT